MSYLVFARKYRPLSFDDVVGQQHITRTLATAIQKNRVAHAYVFTGTRGVGKTTTARILARALNCEKGPTPTPCGECESCRQIIAGSSFDVLEIDGASNRGVEDIRQLRENITYSAMAGKYRVIVIDEVHMLTREAFNALLKTLEEPPPRVIFIFATTEPHRIPATIHSRCQRYDFRRISAEQIEAQLARICESEKVAFDPAGLALVARKADGSMRDALSLLDQVHSYCQGRIGLDDVRTVLGVVDTEVYGRIMDAVREKKPEPVLDAVRDVLMHGYDLHEFVLGLEEYLRDLLLARLARPGAPGQHEHLPVDVQRQAGYFTEAALLRMSDAVRRAEYDIRQSAQPRFRVEALLLKLVHMDDTVSLEQLLRMVAAGETVAASAQGPAAPAPAAVTPAEAKKKDLISDTPPAQVAPASAPAPRAPAQRPPSMVAEGEALEEPPARPVRNVGQEWSAFLDMLRQERPSLALFLSHGKVVSCTGTTVDLRFAPAFKFQFSEVTKSANRAIIERAAGDFAGAPVQVHMTLETAAPDAAVHELARRVAPAAPTIEDDIQNEPIIKNVLEVFDGQVLQ